MFFARSSNVLTSFYIEYEEAFNDRLNFLFYHRNKSTSISSEPPANDCDEGLSDSHIPKYTVPFNASKKLAINNPIYQEVNLSELSGSEEVNCK